jgi:hypothetical protein
MSAVIDVANIIERDLRSAALVHPPIALGQIDHICHLAGQLKLSRAFILRDGCRYGEAAAFVMGTDELQDLIEALGGFDLFANTQLVMAHSEASTLCNALLAVMIAAQQ